MSSIKDDRGYNQGFKLVKSTEVRMRRRATWMIDEMTGLENKNVLEIGCGTGEVAYWIASQIPAQILGTDLCVPFIDDARKKYVLPNLRYEIFDFNKAEEFKGEKFDYIIGNGILHHLYPQLTKAFENMRKLLKDGGKIIFLEPNLYNPYIFPIFSIPFLRKAAHLEPDEMAFSRGFAIKLLQQTGYGDIKVTYKDFLVPGIPDFMIQPSIAAGNILEKIPVVKAISQSIFITAVKS